MPTMTPAADGVPYRVPPEPNRWPAIVLAAAVHVGLLLFLWVGISWQNTAPVQVEAEVWDMKTQAAAPPPPPAATPEPVQAEEPAPPPPPLPKAVEPQVQAPKPPDIALERQKKLKEEKLRKQEEKRLEKEQLEKEREQEDKKLAAEKKLAEKKQAEKDAAAEKKQAEKDAAAEKKLADKLAKAKQAAEDKKLKALRDAEMRRITGAAGSVGDAPKATAPRLDSGYLASITSKIKSATTYLGNTDVPGNPRAVFTVKQLPTGEIMSVKMIKSSGIPAFDDAVEKGINKSSPLPKKKDGTVETTLEVAFSMKDLH